MNRRPFRHIWILFCFCLFLATGGPEAAKAQTGATPNPAVPPQSGPVQSGAGQTETRSRPADRSNRGDRNDSASTLGLEQGFLEFDTPDFNLKLVKASQTVAALPPKGAGGFDFTPADQLSKRTGNHYFQLGDLTLRLRVGGAGDW